MHRDVLADTAPLAGRGLLAEGLLTTDRGHRAALHVRPAGGRLFLLAGSLGGGYLTRLANLFPPIRLANLFHPTPLRRRRGALHAGKSVSKSTSATGPRSSFV
jgi:hypothetical protein